MKRKVTIALGVISSLRNALVYLFALFSLSANADIAIYEFQGQYWNPFGPDGRSVNVAWKIDGPISGTFTVNFDFTVPDSSSDPRVGLFEEIASISFTVLRYPNGYHNDPEEFSHSIPNSDLRTVDNTSAGIESVGIFGVPYMSDRPSFDTRFGVNWGLSSAVFGSRAEGTNFLNGDDMPSDYHVLDNLFAQSDYPHTGNKWQVTFYFNANAPPWSDRIIYEITDLKRIYPNDSDGDGMLDDFDLCPDTSMPEINVPGVSLKPNHWALVDDDIVFDTVYKGNSGLPGFTTMETGGCSCEQIIDQLGFGKGQQKFGCSRGTIEDWLDLIDP